ncbi:MAG: peptidylprolyl isomerase [Ignavibacteriales bacterium]|nr:peptidylprolyl isomerase [Ignavibacteriales bacterium]
MGMMARMRSLAPWFILTVGGLFILFMVLSDSRVLDFTRTQSQNVGSVDGEDISYQDYSNTVERLRKQQEQAGQQISEEQMDYFRDQVWDMMVTQKLLDKKIKEFGIVVTDDEVRDAIMGPNPPADIRQQFTDSTGTFNRQAFESAMRDPRNKQILITIEERERQRLTQQKLQNILFASVTATENEAYDNFIRQNIKMKAKYIAIDPNTIPDSDVKVTDEDLKKYYDEHAEEYKIENQRRIKYVLFNRQPSQSDSLIVKKNLEAIVAKLKADTASFKSYVQSYSEQPYKKDTVAMTTLPAESRDVLMKANKGDIVGPVKTYEGYVVYKLVDKVASKNEMVRASHILIRSTGNDAADKQKIDEIYNELMKGANFEQVARTKSQDGSASQGGDLGWFGKGQMVKPFEDACYSGKIGQIQKPIKTQFGYHIIKVTGRSNQSFVIEKIVNKVTISATTSDKIFQDASDFAYVAKENGFESEAKALKYSVIETPPFNEEAAAIAGLGINKALVKWAFESSVGEVSDVFRFPAGYAVAMVSEIIKPGMKSFDEVKASIRSNVLRMKKLEKAVEIAKNIKSKIGDSGDPQIATSVWASAKIDTTGEFNSSGSIPKLGREYAFAEVALKADLDKWTSPVKGTNYAYLINVTYRTKYDPQLFAFQKEAIKKELINNKRNIYLGQWVEQLKKEAKIVDDRYKFYR